MVVALSSGLLSVRVTVVYCLLCTSFGFLRYRHICRALLCCWWGALYTVATFDPLRIRRSSLASCRSSLTSVFMPSGMALRRRADATHHVAFCAISLRVRYRRRRRSDIGKSPHQTPSPPFWLRFCQLAGFVQELLPSHFHRFLSCILEVVAISNFIQPLGSPIVVPTQEPCL